MLLSPNPATSKGRVPAVGIENGIRTGRILLWKNERDEHSSGGRARSGRLRPDASGVVAGILVGSRDRGPQPLRNVGRSSDRVRRRIGGPARRLPRVGLSKVRARLCVITRPLHRRPACRARSAASVGHSSSPPPALRSAFSK
jgi:hypothetical protein